MSAREDRWFIVRGLIGEEKGKFSLSDTGHWDENELPELKVGFRYDESYEQNSGEEYEVIHVFSADESEMLKALSLVTDTNILELLNFIMDVTTRYALRSKRSQSRKRK